MSTGEATALAPGALIIPNDRAFFDTTVCGTSIMLRAVCALGKVVPAVHVLRTPLCAVSSAEEVESEINGREFRPLLTWTDRPDSVPVEHGLFVVAEPGVFDPRLCAAMQSLADGDDRVVACRRPGEHGAPVWFLASEPARRLIQYLSRSADAAPARFLESERVQELHPDSEVCEIVSDEQSRRVAERKLLQGARKDSDSLIARYDRKVSSLITRWVVRVPVTPNQLTVMNTALGLAGAAMLLSGTYWLSLIGSSLLLLSIILDGCDGEVARIKFMETSFGRKLDFFLDNVVNAFAIFAVGAGYAWRHDQPLYFYLSTFNAAAALASVWPVYVLFFRDVKQSHEPPSQKLAGAFRVAEGLNGRDFIYLIFFLAAAGKAHWFAFLGLGLAAFLPLVLVLFVTRWFRTRDQRVSAAA
jgi:phosphatidylglycerophosphate synthase